MLFKIHTNIYKNPTNSFGGISNKILAKVENKRAFSNCVLVVVLNESDQD